MTITWSSNCAGFGEVQYGLTPDRLTNTAQDTNLGQDQSVVLNNLIAGQTYSYTVSTLNRNGEVIVQSGILNFTTIAFTPTQTSTSTSSSTATSTFTVTPTDTPTVTPSSTATNTATLTSTNIPIVTSTPTSCTITQGPSAQVGGLSVTISWASNCTGFGQVQYGLSALRLNNTVQDTNLTQSHSILINNLVAGLTYSYEVATLNRNGVVLTQSGILNFITAALAPTSTPTLAPANTATPTASATPSFTPTATADPTDTPASTFTPVPPTDTPTDMPADNGTPTPTAGS